VSCTLLLMTAVVSMHRTRSRSILRERVRVRSLLILSILSREVLDHGLLFVVSKVLRAALHVYCVSGVSMWRRRPIVTVKMTCHNTSGGARPFFIHRIVLLYTGSCFYTRDRTFIHRIVLLYTGSYFYTRDRTCICCRLKTRHLLSEKRMTKGGVSSGIILTPPLDPLIAMGGYLAAGAQCACMIVNG
jgi:hypothetical protein